MRLAARRHAGGAEQPVAEMVARGRAAPACARAIGRRSTRRWRAGRSRRKRAEESLDARDRGDPSCHEARRPRSAQRRGSSPASGRPISASIAPVAVGPAQAGYNAPSPLRRVIGWPSAGQHLGELALASASRCRRCTPSKSKIMASNLMPRPRSPNKAVPTRTWVAPIVTAVSIIGRHAHAEAGEAVPARQLGEQREIGRRLDARPAGCTSGRRPAGRPRGAARAAPAGRRPRSRPFAARRRY